MATDRPEFGSDNQTLTVRPGTMLLGPLVRRRITAMFGQPPISSDALPDHGLVGPGSASWRIIGEPAAILGGIRGLLLQICHPSAMAGVADHSAFRTDPLGRLQRTSAWVTTTTFGTMREAAHVTHVVRAMHRKVRGTTPGGNRYDASDPKLLAWVSIALTSSFLVADRLWSPNPATTRQRDAFVLEQSRIAALLDPRVDVSALADLPACQWHHAIGLPMMSDGTLPSTETQLSDKLEQFLPELGMNDQGTEAVQFLCRPPLSRSTRIVYRQLLRGVVASLTSEHREILGLSNPGDPAVSRARNIVRLLRTLTGTSPTVRIAIDRTRRVEATHRVSLHGRGH